MIRELVSELSKIDAQLAALKEQRESVIGMIATATADAMKTARALHAKEFGAESVVVDGIKIIETISKKVEWDQKAILGVRIEIEQNGFDPAWYMDAEYKISEAKWKEFDDATRAAFAPARIVKPGKPTYKFEEVGK